MTDFRLIKDRISKSLAKLDDLLDDYERVSENKIELNHKINLLRYEHMTDLSELNSLINEMENFVGESEND